MPTYIIIIGNFSNFLVFSTPIIISVIIYVVLTKVVQRKQLVKEPDIFSICTVPSVRNRAVNRENSINNGLDAGYSVEDLPYPLNAIQESIQSNADPSKVTENHITIDNFLTSTTQQENKSLRDQLKNLISSKPNQPSAEIEAALTSMKTNLLMMFLFFINTFILFIPSPHWRMFLASLFESFLKFWLPTATTISNFGPVREVVIIYIENFKDKLKYT